jgi:hypothetical protein
MNGCLILVGILLGWFIAWCLIVVGSGDPKPPKGE